MSSGTVKKNHSEISDSSELNVKEFQRAKFKIIGKMASELLDMKNHKERYSEISDFFVSFLSVPTKKIPIEEFNIGTDILSDDVELEYKEILKQEFADAIEDYKNTLIEKEFIDVVSRASKQYDKVYNIEI